MRLALAVVSLLVFTGSGLVVYEQSRSRWQDEQKAYFHQALAIAKSPAERAALTSRAPKLEQTIVTAFGDARVDRCETCHIAVDDPRFDGAKEPLRAHPYSAAMGDVFKNGRWERRHKFSEFGCSACHDGQGRGLTRDDAHGEDASWTKPLMGYTVQADWKKEYAAHLRDKEYIQANCARCHAEKNFAGAPLVAKGRELFFKTGCFGCHRIEGLSSGTLGVDLTEVGKERKLDYLWGHIADPRAYTPTSIMPQFKLSDDDRKALVIFLKSRQGINYGESAVASYKLATSTEKPVPESAAAVESKLASNLSSTVRGAQLIEGYACLSCHRLGEHDGGISPDLSYEGLERDQAWLMDHFRTPRSRVPDSNMPAFGLPDSDYQDMSAYLLTRVSKPATGSPSETYKVLCARCHGEKGDGKGANAIYLDPAPRDLTRAEFMNSKPEARLIESITNGVPGTSMPEWGRALDQDQVKGLLAYIQQSFVKKPRRELKPRKLPDQNPVAVSTGSISRGESIYLQRCTGCHGRKADGHGPNSVDISPRPRNLRNAAFINNTPDRRLFESITYGVEGTAMPSWIDYGLSQNDIGDIVNYIRSLNPREARTETPGGVNGNTSTGRNSTGR